MADSCAQTSAQTQLLYTNCCALGTQKHKKYQKKLCYANKWDIQKWWTWTLHSQIHKLLQKIRNKNLLLSVRVFDGKKLQECFATCVFTDCDCLSVLLSVCLSLACLLKKWKSCQIIRFSILASQSRQIQRYWNLCFLITVVATVFSLLQLIKY